MPIYEYHCKKCGEFELMQRITEHPLTRCPTCRGKVTKLMSSTSFQLKGSGWYVTDYPRKDSKKDVSTESKSESKSETKETSSDAKASKADTKASKVKEAAAA